MQRIDAEARKQWEQRRRLIRAMGGWLGQYSWSYFVTLTFHYEPSQQAARRQFLRWVRRLTQRAGNRVPWFMSLEYGAAGRLHIHTLVFTSRLAPTGLCDAWLLGRADVQADRFGNLLTRREILRGGQLDRREFLECRIAVMRGQ